MNVRLCLVWHFFVHLLGPVLRGGGDSRLHLPRNPPGDGGWEGQVWAWVRLVVPGCLHVWNAVWRDSFLCRVPGGNVWEDHEPQGELIVWSWFWYVYMWDFYTLSSFNWNSYKKSAVTGFQTEVKKNDNIRLKYCVLNLVVVFLEFTISNLSIPLMQPLTSRTGEISVPATDHRRVGGRKGSDSSAHLQSRAPTGPERHWGLQAPPLLHWYSLTSQTSSVIWTFFLYFESSSSSSVQY